MRVFAMLAAVLLSLSLAAVPAQADVSAQGFVTRDQMIANAKRWLTAYNGGPVPYSMTSKFEGYRQDCSGFVSMAARLSSVGGGLITTDLASDANSVSIAKESMRKGDLMVDSTGDDGNSRHVVIFESWSNAARTSYIAIEQRSVHGTDRRVRSYGFEPNSEYKARRLKNITG